MPELHLERRPQAGVPWWVWAIAAVLVVLIILWLIAAANTRPEQAAMPPQERVAGERATTPGAPSASAMALLPIAQIHAEPNRYFGQSVAGTATVAEIVSDRAFWVEEAGNRLLVVLAGPDAMPQPAPTAGQRVEIRGVVQDPTRIDALPEAARLAPGERRLLEAQPAFIQATSVAPAGETAPGATAPAATAPAGNAPAANAPAANGPAANAPAATAPTH